MILPTRGLLAVHRQDMLARLENLPRLRLDLHRLVIRHIAGDLGGQDAIEVNLSVLVMMQAELQSLHFPSGIVNSRRSQMSDVFHSVRTTAPGVPWVPKPPGPSFQAEASNSGLNQFVAGA